MPQSHQRWKAKVVYLENATVLPKCAPTALTSSHAQKYGSFAQLSKGLDSVWL